MFKAWRHSNKTDITTMPNMMDLSKYQSEPPTAKYITGATTDATTEAKDEYLNSAATATQINTTAKPNAH